MDENKNSVSIIVPLYKGEKYVENILKMVQHNVKELEKKGIKWDVELVLINDFPQEKIRNKGEDWGYDYKLINNEHNMGIHRSRVRGIKESKGKYILMLDQDDEISPAFLASQISQVIRNPSAKLIVGNGYIQHSHMARQIYQYGFMQRTVKNIKAYAYMDNRIESPGQCLIRRDAIPEFWMNHFLENNGSDDYMLWLLMLSELKTSEIALNSDLIYTHVNTNNNLSLNVPVMYRSVNEVVDLLQKSGLVDHHILDIIDYRMHLLQGKLYKGSLEIGSRCIVRAMCLGGKRLVKHRDSNCHLSRTQ